MVCLYYIQFLHYIQLVHLVDLYRPQTVYHYSTGRARVLAANVYSVIPSRPVLYHG